MPFWDGFLLGLAAGIVGDAVIGVFLTAPMAVWWFRRKLPSLVNQFTSDKELMAQIRQKFVGGFFGGLSSGNLSWQGLLKRGAAVGMQKLVDKMPEFFEKAKAVKEEAAVAGGS